MSAPSTLCTPPPGHWPSAATRCSRSRSRRCAGSASAPGGSARSPPPPSSCSTTSTAAPHDQQVVRDRYWEWFNGSRRSARYGQVAAFVCPSPDHHWSRDELEAVPGGDPPSNLPDWNGQTLCRRPAVDDDGVDGVLPQRGLPPTGIPQKIGLQAAAHTGGGVHGVLAVAVLHTAAERHLRQIALAQPLVLQRLGARRTSEM